MRPIYKATTTKLIVLNIKIWFTARDKGEHHTEHILQTIRLQISPLPGLSV